MFAHKSINIRPEVWKQARINAELSGVALRDYLSYLIVSGGPIDAADEEARHALEREQQLNRSAHQDCGGSA